MDMKTFVEVVGAVGFSAVKEAILRTEGATEEGFLRMFEDLRDGAENFDGFREELYEVGVLKYD